jgi:alpha-D-xyloside xylohydrolase
MREDGVVDFYLPEGTWTHLLSGETMAGGGWRRAQYDFFSLPVFVRENTILPMGARGDTPEYDYADGLTLRLYRLADGAEASRSVCNTRGEVVLTAHAKRRGDFITVTLKGAAESVKVEQIGTACEVIVR